MTRKVSCFCVPKRTSSSRLLPSFVRHAVTVGESNKHMILLASDTIVWFASRMSDFNFGSRTKKTTVLWASTFVLVRKCPHGKAGTQTVYKSTSWSYAHVYTNSHLVPCKKNSSNYQMIVLRLIDADARTTLFIYDSNRRNEICCVSFKKAHARGVMKEMAAVS